MEQLTNQDLLGAVQSAVHAVKQDILDVIRMLQASVDQRFDKVDQRFDKVDQRLDALEEAVADVKEEMTGMKDEMTGMKDAMVTKTDLATELSRFEYRFSTRFVTKDYLDMKLSHQYSDLVILFRKEIAIR